MNPLKKLGLSADTSPRKLLDSPRKKLDKLSNSPRKEVHSLDSPRKLHQSSDNSPRREISPIDSPRRKLPQSSDNSPRKEVNHLDSPRRKLGQPGDSPGKVNRSPRREVTSLASAESPRKELLGSSPTTDSPRRERRQSPIDDSPVKKSSGHSKEPSYKSEISHLVLPTTDSPRRKMRSTDNSPRDVSQRSTPDSPRRRDTPYLLPTDNPSPRRGAFPGDATPDSPSPLQCRTQSSPRRDTRHLSPTSSVTTSPRFHNESPPNTHGEFLRKEPSQSLGPRRELQRSLAESHTHRRTQSRQYLEDSLVSRRDIMTKSSVHKREASDTIDSTQKDIKTSHKSRRSPVSPRKPNTRSRTRSPSIDESANSAYQSDMESLTHLVDPLSEPSTPRIDPVSPRDLGIVSSLDEDVTPVEIAKINSVFRQKKTSSRTITEAYWIEFRLIAAKGTSTKYNSYFIVKLISPSGNIECDWSTPINFGNANLTWEKESTICHVPSLEGLTFIPELWKVKKKMNKMAHSGFLSSDLFVIGSKQTTNINLHKDLTVTLEYTIHPIHILSDRSYLPLVVSLLDNDMAILLKMLRAIGQRPRDIKVVISLLTTLHVVDYLIQYSINIEINGCDAFRTLFRQDTVYTCILDTFIQQVGSKYLISTLKPFVQYILEEKPSCAMEHQDLTQKEDILKNVQTMNTLINKLVTTITQSTSSCPHGIKVLLSKVHTAAIEKWPYELDVWVTAVTAFLFLRFFVPALLDPCKYNLCQDWELRFHEKMTLMNLGIAVQKMANLSVFSPSTTNSFHLLNGHLRRESLRIYEWVTDLCDDLTGIGERDPRVANVSQTFGFNAALLVMICKENLQTYKDLDRSPELERCLKNIPQQ
eukprot:TRINITY_DN5542_c0_g1_i1.p1 TRINITY_DN5542_c0_g1~~TRINITY_DN5542_c0_g1_i1.p1  ORF type:complete len:1000 (-),score=127.30 TRINITY_DN5542_c0_g1_i1:833-3442(-)